MFPGTLSKDNVDGRHYNSNLNIAFVFETFVPFNICLAFGDIRSCQSTEREQIYLSGCYF